MCVIYQVTRGCEEAVRTLSASAQADVYIEAAHEGCDMNVKISRTRFEDLCFDIYKAAGGVIKEALAAASTSSDKVDMVLLAGGEMDGILSARIRRDENCPTSPVICSVAAKFSLRENANPTLVLVSRVSHI